MRLLVDTTCGTWSFLCRSAYNTVQVVCRAARFTHIKVLSRNRDEGSLRGSVQLLGESNNTAEPHQLLNRLRVGAWSVDLIFRTIPNTLANGISHSTGWSACKHSVENTQNPWEGQGYQQLYRPPARKVIVFSSTRQQSSTAHRGPRDLRHLSYHLACLHRRLLS